MIAPVAGVAALVTVLVVVLTRQPANHAAQPLAGGAESIALQSANAQGPAPFAPSVARTAASGPASAPGAASVSASELTPVPGSASAGGVASVQAPDQSGSRGVQGSAAGLYGGSEQLSSCDVAQLSDYLAQHPDKARAWAGVEGVAQGSLSGYLRSLTPVLLRMDTRVTNYGFSSGSATPFPAVLQAGTAVLIDARGLPRARCACGNPLRPPVASNAAQTFTGAAWTSFRPENVVVVNESVTEVNVLVLYDHQVRVWFARPVGSHGADDQRVPPPPGGWRPGGLPSTSWSAAPSGSASPSATASSPSAPASSASPSPWRSPSPPPRSQSASHSPSHSASGSTSSTPSHSPSHSPSRSHGPLTKPEPSSAPSTPPSSVPPSASPSPSASSPSASGSGLGNSERPGSPAPS